MGREPDYSGIYAHFYEMDKMIAKASRDNHQAYLNSIKQAIKEGVKEALLEMNSNV